MVTTPTSLMECIEAMGGAQSREWRVAVCNRTEPEPVQQLLENLFGDLTLEVVEADVPAGGDDVVILVRGDEVVASSPLDALLETILLVNADLYTTGTRSLDAISVPDVIERLADTPFVVSGYPARERAKIVLVAMSRHIERRAWVAGSGTVRVMFQRFSRLDDELGTRRVYERLSATDLDIHLYGVPDAAIPDSVQATLHGGSTRAHRSAWAVVFDAPESRDSAALVAKERGDNEFRGSWTFDAATVDSIDRFCSQSIA